MINGFNEYYKEKEHVSISSLTSFARCPRLYFYQSGCRMKPPGTPIWFTYGTALHEAMPFCIRRDLKGAMSAFMSVWQNGDMLDDSKRNTGRALALMEEVVRQHEDPLYVPIDPPEGRYELDSSVTMDEVAFALDIGLEKPFVGKADAVGRHRDTGTIYAIEYKTASRMSAGFLNSFGYNPQTIGYALAMSMMFDEKVDGTIMEVLGVAKTMAKVALHPVQVREQQYEEFLAWVVLQTSRIKECETLKDFPKDCSACTPYPQFGQDGFDCKFKDFCLVGDWRVLVDTMEISTYDLFSTTKVEALKGNQNE